MNWRASGIIFPLGLALLLAIALSVKLYVVQIPQRRLIGLECVLRM